MPFETQTRRWDLEWKPLGQRVLNPSGVAQQSVSRRPRARRFRCSMAPHSWIQRCYVLGVRNTGESLRIRRSAFGCAMAPRENILGIGVSAINMDDAVEIISNWIDK